MVEVILKKEILALIEDKEATISAGKILELDWLSPNSNNPKPEDFCQCFWKGQPVYPAINELDFDKVRSHLEKCVHLH